MACDNDQPGIELCFGLCREEYSWWALAGTGHCVMLHSLRSVGPICHEVDQLRYFEEGGGHAVRVSEYKVDCRYTRHRASSTAAPAQV